MELEKRIEGQSKDKKIKILINKLKIELADIEVNYICLIYYSHNRKYHLYSNEF